MNPFPRAFAVFLALVAGALAMRVAPALLEALAAPGVPALWWATRAFGLLAYLAMWLSMLFGVLVAGRGAGGLFDRATVLELHTRWALVALVATALHVLAAVAAPHGGVSPLAVVVPFASATLRGAVALGTLALWGMGLVAASTALVRRLPKWTWRAIHATSFGTLALALVHAAAAGSESGVLIVRGLYAASVAALLGAVMQRALLAARQGAKEKRTST